MPDATQTALIQKLSAKIGGHLLATATGPDMAILTAKPDSVYALLRTLRDDLDLKFGYLIDLTAVDYLNFPERYAGRFAVVYHLHSFTLSDRIRVQVFLPAESPALASAADLWGNAAWLEREVFDLYGIRFTGHPDLRRILMPDDYPGHPLRKDYPLRGRGERERFDQVTT